jgi:hypothetical protein
MARRPSASRHGPLTGNGSRHIDFYGVIATDRTYLLGEQRLRRHARRGLGGASSNNVRLSRHQATTWLDTAGRLWLFGGYGANVNASHFD